MTFHFDQDDALLKGFIGYFQGLSDESQKQAQELMEYQNLVVEELFSKTSCLQKFSGQRTLLR